MTYADPTYPLFPIFAFVGFVIVLIPLPWHFQSWNAGTCLYMVWTALGCLNQFINSVVWKSNALNPAPVWCDISSRLTTGVAVAIPAASLCINRRLYKIASVQTVSISRGDKRRAVIEDLSIGLGIPILQMALAYIVNGHRFDIYEGIGCYPAIYNVWLVYPLVMAWPIAIGCVSAVYCVLSLRAFHMKRTQFKELLSSKNSTLTVNRYFRLMALATIELLCTIPIATYFLYLNASSGILPYKGWADLHFNWSHVGQFPATIWRLSHSTVVAQEMTRWLVVICAYIFFGFFGFAAEARRNYARALRPLGRFVPGFLKSSKLFRKREEKLQTSAGVLPVFVQRPPIYIMKRVSLTTDTTLSSEPKSPRTPSTSSMSSTKAEKRSTYDECFSHAI